MKDDILAVVKLLATKPNWTTIDEVAAHQLVARNKDQLTPDVFRKKVAAELSAMRLSPNWPLSSRPKRKGQYGYRPKSERVVQTAIPATSNCTQYTGKAGEFAVMTELTFLHYQVALTAIDNGLDLIAIRNHKPRFLQVKTTLGNSGVFVFKVSREIFKLNSGMDIFYVFVCRTEAGFIAAKTSYVLFPSSEIRHLDAKGLLGSSDQYHFKLTQQKGRMILGGTHDITTRVNNWDCLS